MSHSSTSIPSVTPQDVQELRTLLYPSLQTREWYTVLTAAVSAARIGAQAVPLIWKAANEEQVGQAAADHKDAMAVEVAMRVKEALLKGSVIFGICAALDPLFALTPLLRAEAAQHPGRSQSDLFARHNRLGRTEEELTTLAHQGLRRVYRHNLDEILENKFGSDNRDIQFATMEINYGWNLSEDSILDFPSTELVILAALIPTPNVPAETMWHLRGCRRAGWSDEIINSVRSLCIRVVDLCKERSIGMYSWDASRLPTLEDIKENSND
ncbi:hypothetical protein OC846_002012 [Tilletia horrida]|uniref:Carboxymuconolactone decarboxylase-like domain-containing protein n=1 Tax=Tilletia horrida TaxID=155126 RepID=A0AAN6GSU6_9BASI|nr:hypothetical protein OC846_002012 [Tilletia horrida]KAK0569818.1 hypothetical protein OC861_000529 [Tilletia horrida]